MALSTAGAIPILNEKGEVSMRKVKVHRYVSGKRPDYACHSGEESDEEFPFEKKNKQNQEQVQIATIEKDERDDPRLRRLQKRKCEGNLKVERHRHIHEPEVLITGEEEQKEEEIKEQEKKRGREEPESSEEDLDDDEIINRRLLLRKKQLDVRETEVEMLEVEEEEEPEPESEESASEYEECSESDEEVEPKLKPVFVRKRDRVTVQEREKIELQQLELELEAKKMAEERRKESLKIIEEANRKEQTVKDLTNPSAVVTDDENDEAEYETWKLRELKRLKRDRDEREAHKIEQMEIERRRNMTEEERRIEEQLNPKFVTNKSVKGKYKFLQRYYHRGAFFLDEEEDVLKKDFSQPTLEDHFNKTVLPKVMQVKNFGRAGRSKYTHLVDQDTTQFDSPWVQQTAQNLKFHSNQSAGMKQTFDRPSLKRRK